MGCGRKVKFKNQVDFRGVRLRVEKGPSSKLSAFKKMKVGPHSEEDFRDACFPWIAGSDEPKRSGR
jgi:hypothetical protein